MNDEPQYELPAANWPLLTAELPGIAGTLKSQPEDFEVEEIPAYAPCGEGEHLFLWIEKRGVAADELTRHLSSVLDVSPNEFGIAGLKDKQAVTRQFVSVPRRFESLVPTLNTDNIRVLSSTPHQNKLRTGHLHGNRFRILVRNVEPDALAKATAIAERVRLSGLPNYFGSQRFGHNNSTLRQGLSLLSETGTSSEPNRKSRDRQRSGRRFLHRLALSAAQSWLFNQVLAERLRDGLLDRVLLGDVMQVCATGGLFVALDLSAEQPRFDARETVTTGPMFGPKMKPTTNEPAVREQRVLDAAKLSPDAFRRYGHLTDGTRRPLLVRPDDLQISESPDGLLFEFTLPSGCYATVLLHEFMKAEGVIE
ncbi:MAG: tRNA pseudouridine(13) synthase TruD [Planctomycetaceae bacterium]